MTAPPAWMEKCYASIEKYETSDEAALEGIADKTSLDISVGDKPMEGIALLNQGRVYKYSPEEDTEISVDLYCKNLNLDSGAIDVFFIGGTPSTTDPRSFVNTNTRDKFRLTILFTNDSNVTGATDTVNASGTHAAKRYIFADAYITSYKPSFTDGILKVSCTVKCPPFDADANGNITYQSLDGDTTAVLSQLAAYSGTTKF